VADVLLAFLCVFKSQLQLIFYVCFKSFCFFLFVEPSMVDVQVMFCVFPILMYFESIKYDNKFICFRLQHILFHVSVSSDRYNSKKYQGESI
jgi:hypothetical protein